MINYIKLEIKKRNSVIGIQLICLEILSFHTLKAQTPHEPSHLTASLETTEESSSSIGSPLNTQNREILYSPSKSPSLQQNTSVDSLYKYYPNLRVHPPTTELEYMPITYVDKLCPLCVSSPHQKSFSCLSSIPSNRAILAPTDSSPPHINFQTILDKLKQSRESEEESLSAMFSNKNDHHTEKRRAILTQTEIIEDYYVGLLHYYGCVNINADITAEDIRKQIETHEQTLYLGSCLKDKQEKSHEQSLIRNHQKAYGYFCKLASYYGHGPSQYHLALMNAEGKEQIGCLSAESSAIPADKLSGALALLSVSDNSSSPSILKNGAASVSPDIGCLSAESLRWITKSAEQGYGPAQYYLGLFHEERKSYGAEEQQKAIQWYRRAGVQKHPLALYAIGGIYINGQGVKANQSLGLCYYKEAADLGCVQAMLSLGLLYKTGNIVEPDLNKAFYYLEKAAQHHQNEAQYIVAQMYQKGQGVEQSITLFISWLKKAAQNNHVTAQSELGNLYQKGIPPFLRQSYKKAAQYLREAGTQGDAEAQYSLGMMYYTAILNEKNNKYCQLKHAFEWLRRAALQHHKEALFNLGLMHKNGQGILKNIERALMLFEESWNQGYEEAGYYLADIYESGDGVNVDHAQAFEWYFKAASLHHQKSQYVVAHAFEEGKLAQKKDLFQAFRWYKKAERQNYAPAQNKIGLMYSLGVVVLQDESKAFEYFQKAANQHFPDAQYNLGALYLKGKGVEVSIQKALQWFEKAAHQNHIEAQYELGVFYKKHPTLGYNRHTFAEWLIKAAKQNHTEAEYQLGICYLEQKPAKYYLKDAIFWLQKAAIKNQRAAQYLMGMLHYHGYGVEKNIEISIEWLHKSATGGYVEAEGLLGGLYYTCPLIKRDYSAAHYLLSQAASKNHPEAQYILSVMLKYGHGVEANLMQSVLWLYKAASQHYGPAQYELAKCYEQGEGVTQNLDKAREWFEKAKAQKATTKDIPSLNEENQEQSNLSISQSSSVSAYNHPELTTEEILLIYDCGKIQSPNDF